MSGPSSGTVTAKFTVANTGGRQGVDVVPVYVQRPIDSGGILTPVLGTLVGFARVNLNAGASRSVSVSFPVRELALTPGDINGSAPPQVEPGTRSPWLSLDPATVDHERLSGDRGGLIRSEEQDRVRDLARVEQPTER